MPLYGFRHGCHSVVHHSELTLVRSRLCPPCCTLFDLDTGSQEQAANMSERKVINK